MCHCFSYTFRHNNGKVIDRLLNAEKHYFTLMSSFQQAYLQTLPEDIASKIEQFLNATEHLIAYHQKHYYPSLVLCQNNIKDICDVITKALDDMEFYQYYAAYCTATYRILSEHYCNAEARGEIDNLINVPIEHIIKCNSLIGMLMEELRESDKEYVSDEFKAVAVTEIRYNQFYTQVMDNYNLNAIKGFTHVSKQNKFKIVYTQSQRTNTSRL